MINLMIEPTNRCNLKCPTCFSHQDGRIKKDLSLAGFKKIIRQNQGMIKSLSLYNYGEPFLNKNICKMIAYGKKRGIGFIKIDTNGMFLEKELINDLLKSGLDYLSISLDGATEDIYRMFRKGGDFNKIILNLKNLIDIRNRKKSKLIIEIQSIIMKHNEHQIGSMIKLAKKLNVDILRFKKVLIKRKKWNFLLPSSKEYNRYFDIKQHDSCFKPLEELVINSDGTVIPCCYIVAKDLKKYKLGNILQTTLKKLINSKKYKYFIDKCSTEKFKLSCCLNCEEGNLPLNYKVIIFNERKN